MGDPEIPMCLMNILDALYFSCSECAFLSEFKLQTKDKQISKLLFDFVCDRMKCLFPRIAGQVYTVQT